jgi:hypothetical protein
LLHAQTKWEDSFYVARLVPAARVHCALEGACVRVGGRCAHHIACMPCVLFHCRALSPFLLRGAVMSTAAACAKDWPADAPLLRDDVAALLDAVPPSAAPLADAGAQPAARPAVAPPSAAAPQAAGEAAPPREGVRPPGELRAKLQEGGKPKWLKL